MAINHDDLIGKRFGSLTVLEFAGKNGCDYRYRCKCDCGTLKEVNKYNLLRGDVKSCGCKRAYNKREGHTPKQSKTRSLLQMEDILKQNVVVIEEEYKQNVESLCNTCLHSAAPPSLQCIWDESKATLLPDGATVSATPARVGKKDCIYVKVQKCPLYQDIRLPENKAILLEERQKNRQMVNGIAPEIWHNIRNCKNKNNDDWR